MKRYLVQVEAGGKWHPFIIEAVNVRHGIGKLAMLDVPNGARIGYREAKPNELYKAPTKADIERLGKLGWTRTAGEPA